jgi:hypothetical protein
VEGAKNKQPIFAEPNALKERLDAKGLKMVVEKRW